MTTPHPQQGAFPLFRVKGIQVSLHWSWLLVALWQIQRNRGTYDLAAFAVFEYLGLFAMVLLHEFGHAFTSRSVGGRAENILLWPFGGIAFIDAPRRPGAFLWSIAAGPLVNVALVPVFWLLMHYGLPESAGPDTVTFVFTLFYINLGLLIFNLLPVYPMDGGQILQALLWYRLGYPKALLIATGIGLAGGVALIALALIYLESVYSALLAGFLLLNCWKAFQAARSMVAAMPPRAS